MKEDNKDQSTYKSVGRRKTARASVWMTPGKGKIVINQKEAEKEKIERLTAPLVSVGQSDKFDISVKVLGGGKESQIDAIIHGIARALDKSNPEFRPSLKKAGYFTRDPREKERKKPGLKRARRAPQWAKR